jgi:NADH-quinone oxidoreductase subunit A
MLENYLPILVFVIFGVLMATGILTASKIFAKISRVERPSAEKQSTYECGFEPFEEARTRFDVRFYLVAILFIVFDLEVAFLFPWAVVIRKLGWAPFIAMGIFLLLLIVGFVYEWKKGALEWE